MLAPLTQLAHTLCAFALWLRVDISDACKLIQINWHVLITRLVCRIVSINYVSHMNTLLFYYIFVLPLCHSHHRRISDWWWNERYYYYLSTFNTRCIASNSSLFYAECKTTPKSSSTTTHVYRSQTLHVGDDFELRARKRENYAILI